MNLELVKSNACLLRAFTIVDYFESRNWQQATDAIRSTMIENTREALEWVIEESRLIRKNNKPLNLHDTQVLNALYQCKKKLTLILQIIEPVTEKNHE